MGHIFAHITCTRVKWEATVSELAKLEQRTEEEIREQATDDADYDAASDTVRLEDALEEHGWIDRSWNSRVLHESRNDVRPVVDVDADDREQLEDEIRDALGWLEGGFNDNGDGTFYAADSYKPFDDPWDYSYALRFTEKFFDPLRGWAERPWHPVTDGGFTL